ncbi:MAG: 2-phospho-L-lactate guanylyltransferase [Halieaceae bacterium]|jgi:2-phospho-L-lactate guanylyltransferase
MTWVVLPCKDFVRAKSRLSGVLAPHERRSLTQAMVEDVLWVVSAHPRITGVMLVSDDPCAAMLAAKYQALFLDERQLELRGLNEAVSAACADLSSRGAESILVLHGDVPTLTAREIDKILDVGEAHFDDVILVPDEAEMGTNGMWFAAGNQPQFYFGVNSFELHRQYCHQQGQVVRAIDLPGLGLDVDEPVDLHAVLLRLEEDDVLAPHTRELVFGTGIRARMSVINEVEQNSLIDEAMGTN